MKVIATNRLVTDEPEVKRIAVLIEASEVGKTQPNYLGQGTYTFLERDVGRLIEIVKEKSPGFTSWHFGSNFKELREQYPDPYPYIGAPSAQE